jgi:thiol-disulfide isomerase/thioredoxin
MRMKSKLLGCCLLSCLPALSQESRAIEGFHFSAQALGGQKIDQDRFADSVVLVDLWGTWCPPCREAIPRLADLYGKYKHHGLEILGLAYERGGTPQEQADRVRKFAAEHKITWTLALGDEAVQKQVPQFTGYPTLILFKRGMKHVKTWTGFDEAVEAEIAASVREALEIGTADKPSGTGEVAPEAQEAPEKVPAGRVFRPGNSDTGFDFEMTDADGAAVKFADFRGKPVVLALTTTWDPEAQHAADLLQSLHKEHTGLVVLAGCAERERDQERKNAAIRAFRARAGLGYRLFATDLAFTGKVHGFAALPTFLLFDGEGRLVLREDGYSKEIEMRVRDKVKELSAR